MASNHDDLISIIIPVYNIESYIEKCLHTVCTQTYQNIEVIVVDDGSTDGSGDICRKYADGDNRVKYIYQDNAGLVSARMTGLSKATGEYVVFVDGDDFIDSDHIEVLHGKIMECGADFVHTNYSVNGVNQLHFRNIYSYGRELLNQKLRKSIIIDKALEWRREKEIFECNLYGCIYKKDLICECYSMIPLTQSYGEDLICLVHLIMNCHSAYFDPYSGYNYTLREGSLCHQTSFLSKVRDDANLFNEMERIFDQYRLGNEVYEKLSAFFRQKAYSSLPLFGDTYMKVEKGYMCPFVNMLKGHRIAIYCAGAVGRDYYKQFVSEGSISVAAWFDEVYGEKYDLPMPISDPLSIRDKIDIIDYVVIAINNSHYVDEIIDGLKEIGVDEGKILWQRPVEKTIIANCSMGDLQKQ